MKETLKEFFERHIQKIKDNTIHCEECGEKLLAQGSEVAHILSKSIHPEIATEDNNIVYLCGVYGENKCHSQFDRSLSKRQIMKCHEDTYSRVQQLKEKCEKVSHEYKFYFYK